MPSLPYSKEVQSLYIAYFGRPADSMGLSYWSDVLENQGASLAAVAEGFSRSPEAISLYGSAVGTYELVDRIYHHVFGRAADRVGLDYWGGQLSSGQLSAGSVVLAIVQGAVGSDFTIVQNKLLFAEAFSNLISQTNTLYAGEAAAAVARGLLGKITADTGAAQQATTQIGSHLYDLMLATTNPHMFTANITDHIWNPPAPAGNAPSDGVAPVISDFKPNGATTFTITANEAGLVGLKDSLGQDIGATTSLLANTPTTVVVAPQASVLSDVQVYVKDNAGNVLNATTKLVLGSNGNDTIDRSSKTTGEFIYGFGGNNTVTGGSGNDTIVGGSGNDTITGGGGADRLIGGSGADVFIYTARDESYYSGAGTPLDTIVDFATGTDKVRFSLSGSAVDASSFATVGNFVDGKNNSIAYSTVDKALYVSATGTSLNNTTAGAYVVSSANTIAAGDLEFVIAGTDGDDVLKGGLGNDIITGGDGADSLSGGNGNDLFWYTDNRQLRDDSAVAGGDGIDTIAFSMDIDTLTNGSAQGDNFHADFERASGIERIVLSGSSHVNLGEVLSTVGLTTIVTGDDSTTLRYDNVALGLLNVEASAMADNKLLSLIPATGGAGPWFNVTGLKGDVNAATQQGGIVVAAAAGAGFDVSITGGHGADTLTGGAGNDTIQGGDGVDTLTGGLGQDTMDGGAGADRYIVNSAQESGVSTTSETAAGFDVVTVGDGDLFDFKLSGLSVYTSVWTMDEAMATTGTNFLSQFSRAYLDAYFNDGTLKVAMAVRFQGGETFLIVDTSGDGTITNADAVVQLVGTVSGLGYSNGLVEINPALWP